MPNTNAARPVTPTTSTPAAWSDGAASLRARLAAEGLADHALVLPATLDRTWGDQDGYVVVTGDEALAARCAAYLSAWVRKHLAPRRSYHFQVQGHILSVGDAMVDVRSIPEGLRPHDVGNAVVRGVRVSAVYFPCAD